VQQDSSASRSRYGVVVNMMVTANGVTFSIEQKLKEKIDLGIDRIKKGFDHLLIVDGDEGYGKSTFSTGACAYAGACLGRPYTVENIHFDADEMLDKVARSGGRIVHFDEAATAALSEDFQNRVQKKLIKALMMCRKKGNFWVFCIPKFYKLREYIAVDRSIGLVHVYSRDDVTRGRYIYIMKDEKAYLWDQWKFRHKRGYKKAFSFHGSFSDLTKTNIIDWKEYDRKKDEAIMKVLSSQDENSRGAYYTKYIRMYYALGVLSQYVNINFNIPYSRMGALLKMDARTLQLGLKAKENVGNDIPIESFSPVSGEEIPTQGGEGKQNNNLPSLI
jgi:hypothetical protein